MSDVEPVFSLDRVGLRYNSTTGPAAEVLRDVTFTCVPGEIIGIVGHSGTGKTTLLRLLAGLMPATCGTSKMFGRPLSEPNGDAVIVFQDYENALLPWRTVASNVALPLYKVDKATRQSRVNHALELVSLTSSAHKFPWQLSGGMQQRVQIARALAADAKILLLDEPFGALDAMTRARLQDEILSIHAETRMTMVFITHDIEEAIYLSDRVMIISGAPGTIVEEVKTELPRPRNQLRTRDEPRFNELRHYLADKLAGA